jgi:hypothetical protein
MATKRTQSGTKARAKPAVKSAVKKVERSVTRKGHSPRKQGEKSAYPKHSLPRSTRIATAILDQAAGKACTPSDAAKLLGLSNPGGTFAVEVASSLKYGILERPESGRIQPTALARKILRPQNPNDPVEGYREALLLAPVVSDVYQHYRGENIPDDQFFRNALAEKFGIPSEDFAEFKQILLESLDAAQLLVVHGDKTRVIDITSGAPDAAPSERLKKLERVASVGSHDSCFVMQPFAPPLGTYFETIYRPAIEKAGLRAIRADADIFATGKIMDQVWTGINAARVLVAELTSRNPNVYYELGLAHALKKPVVLVSAKEEDVPFDLQHIRVIYYDTTDPFWGAKLIDKVAENILSAITNPEEAIFRSPQ